MIKISILWIAVTVVIMIAAAHIYFKYIYVPSETVLINTRKNSDVITLKLPNSKDASVFGPKYWEALHAITERIPCVLCRDKAVPFMKFFHDVVNHETEKPIYDPDNFNKHLDYIATLKRA